MTHCPGKIEYNCRYFIMTFRKQIGEYKFGKNCFHTLQSSMSHRPLTNSSSLKITAAYYTVMRIRIAFYADFKFISKAKNQEKMHKNENSQHLLSILAIAYLGHLFTSASRNLKSANNSALF
jgi:hypothetical protein